MPVTKQQSSEDQNLLVHSQAGALEHLLSAFKSLSEADQKVIALYASSGGRRGWTQNFDGNRSANSLRVHLHRATKRLRARFESTLDREFIGSSGDLLNALLEPDVLAMAIRIDKVSGQCQEPRTSGSRYIRVTIELREDEFNAQARNALFDNFTFDRISISRTDESQVDGIATSGIDEALPVRPR